MNARDPVNRDGILFGLLAGVNLATKDSQAKWGAAANPPGQPANGSARAATRHDGARSEELRRAEGLSARSCGATPT